ncbi:hypothetical protein [Paenibacillus lactis]|uniref:hypothetical protein n=1 Tax=Paenibacillus lactis TaxID=228574 RepID=UPI00048B9493|nr:hypothetical protein [Paenibacillus lactis]GIO94140.1 hypothetical protein J31TS3_53670 [Paenibacillus lactis]
MALWKSIIKHKKAAPDIRTNRKIGAAFLMLISYYEGHDGRSMLGMLPLPIFGQTAVGCSVVTPAYT